MFSFDVSFYKTQRFISVRAESLYVCVEFILVDKSTRRYLAEDTLLRNFQ